MGFLTIRGTKECNIYNLYYTKTTTKYNPKVYNIQRDISGYLSQDSLKGIIGGDFNEDMDGDIIKNKLGPKWKHEWRNTKDYSYISGDHRSFIDHFLTKGYDKCCTTAGEGQRRGLDVMGHDEC